MLYRPSFGLSPWREMERLRREMNRLLSGQASGVAVAPGYPAMNIWTNEDGAVVTAELPGSDPKDIDISVNNDTLTVTGCRQPQELPESSTYHRRERGCGRFSRSFQLPFQVEAGKVSAAFERGVLQITLPRAEADKPRKIAVKTA
jgi:HSP20 family protein